MAYEPKYGPCFKVVVTKEFAYRANPNEQFSHDYTFGPQNIPSTDTQWEAMANAIRQAERPIYNSQVKWIKAICYAHNEPHTAHLFQTNWAGAGDLQTGTFTPAATDVKGAGDQASCVQWLSSARSVRGKPIYFRKFHHEPYIVAGGGDSLATDYVAALNTYVVYMSTYLGGQYSTKYPTGTIVGYQALPYVTTRTLKRRGKRPLAP